jgi:hypothetical protein
MRRVVLNHLKSRERGGIYQEQNTWGLLLGNGVKRTFPSAREAKAALAAINRDLSLSLALLNEAYIEAFTWWRREWYNLGAGPSQVVNERNIRDALAVADHALNYAADRCGSTNGNHFTFKHLFSALDHLKEAASLLSQAQKNRGNYAAGGAIGVLISRLEFERARLSNVGAQ